MKAGASAKAGFQDKCSFSQAETPHCELERTAKISCKVTKRCFVPAVPDPLPLLAGLHESGFLKYSHVVRNGRLREVNTLLHVTSAETGLFTDRTGPLFLEGAKNSPARGVGNGVQHTIKGLVTCAHGEKVCREKSIAVNVIHSSHAGSADCRCRRVAAIV
jgi:hypothetical protein